MSALPFIRRTRLEAKQETRRRLLEAARRVFLREGFHGATVDMVAAEAGFTKGAVYSTFASKADLFLALYEARVAERVAAMERQLAGLPPPEARAAVSRTWTEILRRDREWHLVLIEFWVFAARHPAVRKRFEALHRELRSAFTRQMERSWDAAGEPAPADLDLVTRAHMALGNGFALEGFLEPGIVRGPAYERVAAALDAAFLEERQRETARRKAR